MGRLVQLELDNFKSYAGQQTIGPFDNFTCIIGPNGAGKSNMMDAISFVLGVQSTHLRSSHLRELIFRKDASSPPAMQHCCSPNLTIAAPTSSALRSMRPAQSPPTAAVAARDSPNSASRST